MTALSRLVIAFTVLMGLTLACAAPAQAQATRTWISGVGDDVNPCSRTAPCKTFAGAISKTAAGGEIDCLDPGGFGAVTIVKAITLDCGGGIGGQVGAILAAGGPGITINAGVSDRVKIRNLTLNGVNGSVSPGTYGIKFNTGASLTIEHVGIFGFGGGSVAAVEFVPTAAGSKLLMHDVEVQNNLGTGINVAPVSGVAATATLDNVFAVGNGVNGLQATDGASVSATQSKFAGNGRGVSAKSAAGAVQVNLDGVLVANNVGQGVLTQGNNSTIRISNVGIYGNAVGIQATTGVVFSFSNNRIAGNSADGAPTASGPQQ